MFEIILIILALLIFSIAAYQDYKTSYVEDWLLIGLGIVGLIVNIFVLNISQLIPYTLTGLIIIAVGFILNKLGQMGSGDIVAFLSIHLLIPFQPKIAFISGAFPFALSVFINSMIFMTIGSLATYFLFMKINKTLKPSMEKLIIYSSIFGILDFVILYLNQTKLFIVLLFAEVIIIFFKTYEKSINSLLIQEVNAKEVLDEDIIIIKKNGVEKKVLATEKQMKKIKGKIKNYYFLPRLIPYVLLGLAYSIFFGDFIINLLMN